MCILRSVQLPDKALLTQNSTGPSEDNTMVEVWLCVKASVKAQRTFKPNMARFVIVAPATELLALLINGDALPEQNCTQQCAG